MRKLSDLQPSPVDMKTDTVRHSVINALRQVYDPEIQVNIYDLGLIYRIDIGKNGRVQIDMTLTAPGCPVAGSLPQQVRRAVEQVPTVSEASVTLVWSPPWSEERLSDEVRLQLGLL
jgi:FeS assembly SUF system protein